MPRAEMAWKLFGIGLGATVVAVVVLLGTTSLLFHSARAATIAPIVKTPVGQFKGIMKTVYDGSFIVRYAGIPFAQPPVGDLRFRKPEPIRTKSPEKVINAQKFKKSCWSITKKSTHPYYHEDCLYLNVYMPNSTLDQAIGFPVMVWIHGGGFVAGSAFPEPSEFVARGQVIVVTVNYRLGVFGFLTMEDDSLPANNGLWDQVLALQWVKDNIECFGGNSNSITLFGESAGATSSALLALSPVSSSLLNKVIIHSGSATSFLSRNPKMFAEEFGKRAGCEVVLNSTQFAPCLRNVSVKTILEHSRLSTVSMSQAQRQIDFIWMPTIDGDLIPDDPANLLNDKKYLTSVNAFDKDYLFGFSNNDGSLVMENFLNKLPVATIQNMTFLTDLVDFVLTMKYGIPQSSLQNVSDAVISFYSGPQTRDSVRKETVMDLVADAIFYAPGLEMATAMSSCYQYLSPPCNSNVSQQTWIPECVNATGRAYVYFFDFCLPQNDCKLPCMTHGLQLLYQFPRKKFDDDVQQQLSEKLIDLLTSFAKTSQPGSVVNSGWPVFDDTYQSYLSFSPYPSTHQYLYQYRMNMWLDTIPKIVEDETT